MTETSSNSSSSSTSSSSSSSSSNHSNSTEKSPKKDKKGVTKFTHVNEKNQQEKEIDNETNHIDLGYLLVAFFHHYGSPYHLNSNTIVRLKIPAFTPSGHKQLNPGTQREMRIRPLRKCTLSTPFLSIKDFNSTQKYSALLSTTSSIIISSSPFDSTLQSLVLFLCFSDSTLLRFVYYVLKLLSFCLSISPQRFPSSPPRKFLLPTP